MFLAAILAINNLESNPNVHWPVSELKLWYIHMMEYYTATKINVHNNMDEFQKKQSERNQTKKVYTMYNSSI